MAATLDHDQISALYDRIGGRQDWQGFYENPATADLVAHAALGEARALLEFGCGTGRLAASLLEDRLGPDCRYIGIDSSPTMVRLARAKLAPWADRAEVRLSDGALALEVGDGTVDRFLSAYVLDLLSEDDIRSLLAEAHRVLGPGGRLGVVSLTWGTRPLARLVSRAWSAVHRANPGLVGGCRPITLRDYVSGSAWSIEHDAVVSPWGISSEVLVARKTASDEARQGLESDARGD